VWKIVEQGKEVSQRPARTVTMMIISATTMAAGVVHAADWSLTPLVSAEMFYNDNIYMATNSKTDTWGSVLNASLSLKRALETSDFDLSQRMVNRHYGYDNHQDRNDGYTNFAYNDTSERSRFSLAGSYARESTLTSEYTDTGRVDVVRKVNQTTATPTWEYDLSQRGSLTLSGQYTNKNYDAPVTEFADYSTGQASVQYSHAINEPLHVQAVMSRSKVDIPAGAYGIIYAGLITQTDNYQLGFSYDYAENIDFSLLYGKRKSSDEIRFLGTPIATFQSEGATYNLTVSKTFEHASAKLNLTRDYSPSGNGVVYETDTATISAQYRLSEISSTNLEFTYLNQKPGTTSYTAVQRTYYSALIGYHRNLNEGWTLGAYYRYANQKFDTIPGNATGNLVSLSLAYAWPYYHF
jgi:hypothetical protein